MVDERLKTSNLVFAFWLKTLLTQDTTIWDGRRCGREEGKKVEVVARLRIYISLSEHRPPSRRAEKILGTSELCWMTKNK